MNKRYSKGPESSFHEDDTYYRIVNAFQSGNDETAIKMWKKANYMPLPVDAFEKFYILALKLKDMKLLDLENIEQRSLNNDMNIAQENEHLKAEIKSLADAIDSLMKENNQNKNKKSSYVNRSPDHQFEQVKNELDHAHQIIDDQNHKIKHLESQYGEPNISSTFEENRFTKKDDNPYRNNSIQSANKMIEKQINDKVTDIDYLLTNVESTIFKFERKHNVIVSPVKNNEAHQKDKID